MGRPSGDSAAPRPVYVLTGPTAVGKTETSLQVAEALGAEIVSADSMAVYRGMEVATAKPTLEERARVPHHLVDIVDPWEPFTAADYRRQALAAIDGILARGRRALIVGGTRLYIVALTQGFFAGPGADADLRRDLDEQARGFGLEALHHRLAGVDPAAAARIGARDAKRIVRALEVFELTGRPISEWQADSRSSVPPCAGPWVALDRDRDGLYRRIDRRADAMVENGLVEEVRGLLDRGLDESLPALQGHGYKELIGAIRGRYSLDEGVRLLQRNTRRHAKRQLSWLRNTPSVTWVRSDREPVEVVRDVLSAFKTPGATV